MRVLFHTYDLAFFRRGGGEEVMRSLAEALRALGAHVDLFDPWEHDPAHYDLVHYFSTRQKENWHFFRERYPRLPLVVTPTLGPGGRSGKAKLKTWAEFYSAGASFALPDVFLPATEREAKVLGGAPRVPSEKIRILPNGIRPELALGDPSLAQARLPGRGERPLILSVGRFERVKNQATLLRALPGLGEVDCVLVGAADPAEAEYLGQCRNLAEQMRASGPGPRVEIWPPLPPGDPLLASLYAAAQVYVQPSQFETFGLAALEAAAAGCSLALTEHMADRSLFPANVNYFSPFRAESCREALRLALKNPRNLGPRRETLARFSWPAIAQRLRTIYEETLSGYHLAAE